MSTRHRFVVDFNEMVSPDIVLLSRDDMRTDVEGKLVHLEAGISVEVCEEDAGEDGRPDLLVGAGVVIPRPADAGFGYGVKWCCRLNPPGIRRQSEIERPD
jgi:hypothetical protein